MLKKVLSVILCSALAAVSLTSCGKEITVSNTEGSQTDGSQTGENSASDAEESSAVQNSDAEAANFTAPKDGDQIVIIKFKDYGEVKIRLFPEYAEKGVENFVKLAESGYYDGLKFHRIISDFMIQGGDPNGTGHGGESAWGGKFDGGTDPHLIHAAGAVAYANSGSTASNGSQFYIVTGSVYDDASLNDLAAYYGINFSDSAKEIYTTVGGAPWLDGGYTVFGQVFDGLDVIFEIQNVVTDEGNNMPLEDVVMESVTVAEYGGEELNWYISDYTE